MKKEKNELSKKQFETLVAIIDFIDRYHYPPTVRELCDILGKTSPATVHTKLIILKQKGYITYTNGKFRTMKVLKGFESSGEENIVRDTVQSNDEEMGAVEDNRE